MICEGVKVLFCPSMDCGGTDTESERRAKCITGTICKINWEHRLFWVEYECGDTKQKEAFNIYDIGKSVKLIG